MKIIVVKVGKPATKEVPTLVNEYIKRCKTFGPIESLEVKDLNSIPRSHWTGKGKPFCGPGEKLIALDERGSHWTSKTLAANITKWTDDPGTKTLYFLIGGPYGLDDEMRSAATHLWSLSDLTLQGDLAWLVTWEQVYRAFTINKGMPYHHE